MARAQKPRSTMTATHKKALAEGRDLSRQVGRYLDAFEHHKPKRGRRRTKEAVEKRLVEVGENLKNATGVRKLELIQQRRMLEVELAAMTASSNGNGAPSLEILERDFIKAAKPYSEKKGITYAAWREFGIPAPVLKAAGLSRS